MSFSVTTWNVNSLKVRLPQVLDYLADRKDDVLCLQELKMQESAIDRAAINEAGYEIDAFGQKTYNGVAALLRKPYEFIAAEEIRNIPGFEDEQSRLIAVSVMVNGSKLRIVNGYFPNGESLESEKFPYKRLPTGCPLNWDVTRTSFCSATSTSRLKIGTFGIRSPGLTAFSARRRAVKPSKSSSTAASPTRSALLSSPRSRTPGGITE